MISEALRYMSEEERSEEYYELEDLMDEKKFDYLLDGDDVLTLTLWNAGQGKKGGIDDGNNRRIYGIQEDIMEFVVDNYDTDDQPTEMKLKLNDIPENEAEWIVDVLSDEGMMNVEIIK